MHPATLLALMAIVLLALAALRLELSFRRSAEPAAGSSLRRPLPEPPSPTVEPRSPKQEAPSPGPEPLSPKPRLRAAPAGGYCQSTLSAALGRG
jgi:hypothetical protein